MEGGGGQKFGGCFQVGPHNFVHNLAMGQASQIQLGWIYFRLRLRLRLRYLLVRLQTDSCNVLCTFVFKIHPGNALVRVLNTVWQSGP
jgi:hypothetical protein